MTQEPDPGAGPTRSAGEQPHSRGPEDRTAHRHQAGLNPAFFRAGLVAVLFGYMGANVDWSWVVIGAGIAVMMLLPHRGNLSLAIMGALVVFIGVVHGWSWVVILVGLVVMIFLHELGHFLTARWSGMKATEFFIGFGPRLWSFTRGETEYGVKAIPAGAYVRIIGMTTAEEVPPEEEDRTYRQKSFPKRLLVVSAGSLMHLGQALVAAVVLLVFIGVPGGTLIPVDPDHDDEWIVGDLVTDGSAADAAGLIAGDRITQWDRVPVSSFAEVRDEVAASDVGQAVTLTVERDGEEFETRTELVDRLLRVYGGEPVLEPGMAIPGETQTAGDVTSWDGEAVSSFADVEEYLADLERGDVVSLEVKDDEGAGEDDGAEVTFVVVDEGALDDAAAEDLVIEPGQTEVFPGTLVTGQVEAGGFVTAWDGEAVTTFGELRRAVSETPRNDEATLTVRGANGREFDVTVLVFDPPSRQAHPNAVVAMPFLGVGSSLEEDRTEERTLGIVGGVAQAGRDTGELLWMTADGIASFFSPSSLANFFETAFNGGDNGEVSAVYTQGISPLPEDEVREDPDRELMSIIGITRMAANLEPAGLLIAFFAVNLTIGLINMAPLLPFDGGHAVVAIYERVRSRNGKRYFADPDKLIPLAYVGLVLILAIGLTAMFLDIVDPIQL